MPHRKYHPGPVSELAAQIQLVELQAQLQAQQNRAQTNNVAAWLVIAALLGYAFWPKIEPIIPDDIKPIPASSPFGDVDGLKVLIGYEAQGQLTDPQLTIVNSTRLIEAVGSKPNELRRLDYNTEFMPEQATLWKPVLDKLVALNKPMTIAVGQKGKGGFIGECPATEDEVIALVNKYK